MARVKRAVNGKKHRRAVLEPAQGYYGNRSRTFRSANEAVMHSLQYAYRDRRARKGDFRRLWIQRINAGGPGQRHELQPAHRRPARGRGRRRPQGARRPGRDRPRGLRPPGGRGHVRPGRRGARPRWRRRPGTAPDHGARLPPPAGPAPAPAAGAGAACVARKGPSSSKGSSSSPARSRPARRSRRCSSTPGPRAPGRGPRFSTTRIEPGPGSSTSRPGVLERVADTVTPQPVLAVVAHARRHPRRRWRGATFVVVCVDVRDPGNAGAVIRVAARGGCRRRGVLRRDGRPLQPQDGAGLGRLGPARPGRRGR